MMKNSYCSLTLLGKGWKERLVEPTDEHNSLPDKQVIVKVHTPSDISAFRTTIVA
jgi:hypothetical protein